MSKFVRLGLSIVLMLPLIYLLGASDDVFAQDIIVYGSYHFHTLRGPTGLIVEESSNPPGLVLFIADTGNNKIRILWGSSLTTLAGNGTAGYVNGDPASAEFNYPTGLSGGYYALNYHGVQWYYWYHVQVNDTKNFVMREICVGTAPPLPPLACSNGVSTAYTLAGTGAQGYVDGAASSAKFAHLSGLTSSGSFYIADSDNNVIRTLIGSTVATYAGTGTAGLVNGSKSTARFNAPTKAIVDSAGNIIVVDAGNHCIRKINTSGTVSTMAGTGQPGYVNGGATVAKFYNPTSMVYNPADGYYYIADSFNNCIRRMDASGNVTTYAGSSTAGYQDGSTASALFNKPTDLGIANGYMYVSDTQNNCIRQIDMTHLTVTTYLN